MLMPPGFGDTVTVQRSAAPGRPGRATDSFGDRLPSTTHVVAGLAIAPGTSSESAERAAANNRGETVTTTVTAYGPYDMDIRSTDRVVLPDGQRFDAVGDPEPWRDPWSGERVGATIRLKAVRG